MVHAQTKDLKFTFHNQHRFTIDELLKGLSNNKFKNICVFVSTQSTEKLGDNLDENWEKAQEYIDAIKNKITEVVDRDGLDPSLKDVDAMYTN